MTASLRAVVGEGVRRFRDREGVTADAVARSARDHGLKWTASTVLALERGDKAVSAEELFTLVHVLDAVSSRELRLADIVWGDGSVQLTSSLSVRRKDLLQTATCRLGTVRAPIESATPGLAEERAARQLGWSASAVADAAVRLWGHTLTVERDKRAGQGANPQRRGRVTRELLAELERAT